MTSYQLESSVNSLLFRTDYYPGTNFFLHLDFCSAFVAQSFKVNPFSHNNELPVDFRRNYNVIVNVALEINNPAAFNALEMMMRF